MSYIKIYDLNFSYRKITPLFEKTTLSFSLGEMVAIIGRNGSGKTTLAKLMLGMLKPSVGSITIAGKDIKNEPIADIALKVGFVFQNPNLMLFTDTVRKELELSLQRLHLSKDKVADRVTTILSFFKMESYEKTNSRMLSRGERQKLAIATVLIQEPQAIIFDEPFSGVDNTQRLQILHYLNELRSKGLLIILITHHLDFILENCSRIIALKNGKVAYDTSPKLFFKNPEFLHEIGLEKTPYLSLIYSLHRTGVPNDILTKQELTDYLLERVSLQ